MRTTPNDILASRAYERAKAAKPDSRERMLWEKVYRALDATKSIESARTYLLALPIPRQRQDATQMLNDLFYGVSDDEEDGG